MDLEGLRYLTVFDLVSAPVSASYKYLVIDIKAPLRDYEDWARF